MTDAEAQLEGYFAKFEPAIAKVGKELRERIRARLPAAFEIVYLYENQGSLVISYSPTKNGYEAPYSIALSSDGVKLYFGRGAELSKADSKKLLQGRGKTVRHVELGSVADFDRAEIQRLMDAGAKLAKLKLDPSAKSEVIIKAEAQKRRALRANKAPKVPSKRARLEPPAG